MRLGSNGRFWLFYGSAMVSIQRSWLKLKKDTMHSACPICTKKKKNTGEIGKHYCFRKITLRLKNETGITWMLVFGIKNVSQAVQLSNI